MLMIMYLLSTIAILVYAVLAVLSFINGGLSPRSIFFAIVMVLGGAWVAISAFMAAGTADAFADMIRITFTVLTLLYLFMMLFSLTLIRNMSSKQFGLVTAVTSFMVLTFIVIIWMIPVSKILTSFEVTTPEWSMGQTVVGYANFYMIIAQIVIMSLGLTSIAIQTIAYRAATGRIKGIIRNTLISVVVFAVFNLVFNLGFADLHEMHWIGPLSVLIVGPIFYSSVIKHSDDDL